MNPATTFKVLLTSTSQIKADAIKEFFGVMFKKEIELTMFDCSALDLPKQPILFYVNSTSNCPSQRNSLYDGHSLAKERLNFAMKTNNLDDYDFVVSIESCLDVVQKKGTLVNGTLVDDCYALIYHKGLISDRNHAGSSTDVTSCQITIKDTQYFNELLSGPMTRFNERICGYDKTYGEILHEHDKSIDPKNWMHQLYGIDRKDQIKNTLGLCMKTFDVKFLDRETLLNSYDEYKDYPKKNVSFQDIFPLFKNSGLFKLMVKIIADNYKYDSIDYVVGLESRGFCLGTVIAYELGIGFIPVRKENKLPGSVVKCTYEKEYGKDTCEMQKTDLSGKHVLIIDDLIATGGSLLAAIQLVKQLNGTVVDCCVLRQVPELKEMFKTALKENHCSVLLQE